MSGSSLGGARPKSNVRDTDGTLWIAKFPSNNDDRDAGAWEYVAIQMARELGIETPKVRAERFSGNHHTFLTRRFDRDGEQRLHFASAMTLLGYKDGDNHKQGVSYLEIIEIIEQYGCNPRDDIRELWKRIVLSVAISNSDDHLRNHGFLLTKDGWKLSPVYDINPEPMARGLSLNIDEQSNRLDYELCLDVAPWFRWEKIEAEKFIEHTKATVGHWRHYAQKAGIRNSDQDITAPAFAR
ncbi:MAG: type II toxin-antitoxin system HipA family toxin [Bacteroidales bacterium]